MEFIPKAIYDHDTLIGFTSFGYRKENGRHELISMMLGHHFQGKGYSIPIIKIIIDEIFQKFNCREFFYL